MRPSRSFRRPTEAQVGVELSRMSPAGIRGFHPLLTAAGEHDARDGAPQGLDGGRNRKVGLPVPAGPTAIVRGLESIASIRRAGCRCEPYFRR